LPCDAAYAKGEEMGWFEHGSTMLVFATSHFALCSDVREGEPIAMGQALLREL
jgi:phosphatidylserine decarboxylase